MKEFALAFFQESTHRPLLVGIAIGLITFITVSLNAETVKPIYLTLCCVVGILLGFFVAPLFATPIGNFLGLQEVGLDGLQTMLSGYLAYKNIDAFKYFITKMDGKLIEKKEEDGTDS